MEEKISNIINTLKEHNLILKEHEKEIEMLKINSKEFEIKIQNLIEKIDSLVVTLRWFIGLLVGSLVSFFFYVIQRGIFK